NNDIITLYYQLKERIKEKIEDNVWTEGMKIPSERELMDAYKVSRATIRKALDELIVEGLIYRRQGVGTFVNKAKLDENLIMELSFNKQALSKGLNPSSKIINAHVLKSVPNKMKELFELSHDDNVFKVERVRSVDNLPLIIETLYVPEKHAPNLLNKNLEDIAVFQYLEDECQLQFTHSKLEIEPTLLNEFESSVLETNDGGLALSLERNVYVDDRAIVIQKRKMGADRGKFSFVLAEKEDYKHNDFVGFQFIKK